MPATDGLALRLDTPTGPVTIGLDLRDAPSAPLTLEGTPLGGRVRFTPPA